MEYAHHGDPLVPRQQRFGKYARSLMKGSALPVENQSGLRPATVPGASQFQPLVQFKDLDKRGWLTNVTTFNFHPHLSRYALTTTDAKAVHILAQQPVTPVPSPSVHPGRKSRIQHVSLDAPERGEGRRYSTGRLHYLHDAVGGDESLEHFWKNIATK